MGQDAMIFVFWMLRFKPAFSLSSFILIKRIFSSTVFFAFCHKSGVICISEIIDISPCNLDSSLGFIQSGISHDVLGFTHSSVGKESTCNAGDPGSIPGLGRSPGEGICYPFHYSWASLVAQLVNNSHAIQETWVRSLGWENPLEKRKATHSSILAWRIPWTL